MRGSVIFVLFLLALGFFAVVSETQGVGNVGFGGVYPASAAVPPNNASNFTPVVDRGDDPVESLPCTEQPNDCSLHSALAKANEGGKPVTIQFADHYAITLARPLPPITQTPISTN